MAIVTVVTLLIQVITTGYYNSDLSISKRSLAVKKQGTSLREFLQKRHNVMCPGPKCFACE